MTTAPGPWTIDGSTMPGAVLDQPYASKAYRFCTPPGTMQNLSWEEPRTSRIYRTSKSKP